MRPRQAAPSARQGPRSNNLLNYLVDAANTKSPSILLTETVQKALEIAPQIIREMVKPAEQISEIKVLQMGGSMGGFGAAQGTSMQQGISAVLPKFDMP